MSAKARSSNSAGNISVNAKENEVCRVKLAQYDGPLFAQCELRGLHLIAALVAAAVDQVCHGAGQL